MSGEQTNPKPSPAPTPAPYPQSIVITEQRGLTQIDREKRRQGA
jgi:hypothetical protein